MKKRILSVCLCLVLVSGCVLSDLGTLKTKAASAPAIPISIDTELYTEMLLSIYSVLETGMIASGAKEGLDNVDNAMSLSDAFFTFMDSMSDTLIGTPYYPDIQFETEDGRTITFNDESYKFVLDDGQAIDITGEQLQQALWSGVITLDPETETAEDVIVFNPGELKTYLDTSIAMHHKYGQNGEYWPEGRPEGDGGGGGNGGDDGGGSGDQEPEEGTTLFKKIKNVTIGAGLVTAVGTFVNKLFKGETDLDAGIYCDDISFFEYEKDESGKYLYDVYVYPNSDDFYYYAHGASTSLLAVYTEGLNYGGSYTFQIISYNGSSFFWGNYFTSFYTATGLVKQRSLSSVDGASLGSISSTIPVFSSKEAAYDFLIGFFKNSVAPAYDYDDMTEKVPTVLAPITNVKFDPNKMVGINSSLKTAADNVTKSDTSTDKESRTNTYIDAVTSAMQEAAPKTEPETKPGTDTETGTGTGTDTKPGAGTGDGTDTDPGGEMDAEGYKVDLTMIFPFCLPFDLILFIQALDAEPVTPIFEFPVVIAPLDIEEYVTIDLSFMNDLMEIWRLGELGLFIITLIVGTRKMIKW